jgi:molybdopterin-binding protein
VKLSARNELTGTVQHVELGSVIAETICCPPMSMVTSAITHA